MLAQGRAAVVGRVVFVEVAVDESVIEEDDNVSVVCCDTLDACCAILVGTVVVALNKDVSIKLVVKLEIVVAVFVSSCCVEVGVTVFVREERVADCDVTELAVACVSVIDVAYDDISCLVVIENEVVMA